MKHVARYNNNRLTYAFSLHAAHTKPFFDLVSFIKKKYCKTWVSFIYHLSIYMHELDFEFINLNQPKMYKFVVCLLTLCFLLLSGLSNTALARVHHESSNPSMFFLFRAILYNFDTIFL